MADLSRSDVLKAKALVRFRQFTSERVEKRSGRNFRKRKLPTSPPPRLVSACTVYKGLRWLPPELLVPEVLPPEAKLPAAYYYSYYGSSLAFWKLYKRFPITRDAPWRADLEWNDAFEDRSSGWAYPTEDNTFALLRVQGPNPFLLERRGDGFVIDFGPAFAGAFEPVAAHFGVVEGALAPQSIEIGDRSFLPGEPGWDNAKRVVNGLDARYVTFVEHLLYSHLLIGGAFAMAAYSLPDWHPLRPIFDFFTYGTLAVNDTAYRSLLLPHSYFLMSGYVGASDAKTLLGNCYNEFDFDQWLPLKDIEKRGLRSIPNHPYVADVDAIWPVLEAFVRCHLGDVGITRDADVTEDPDLAQFHSVMCRVLPGDASVPRLGGIEDLIDLISGLIFNNVIHEVAGNLSPLLDSHDPADKALANIDCLRQLAKDPVDSQPEPGAADVLLVDQAAFASSFHVLGNALLGTNPARVVDDPKLRDSLIGLQHELAELDDLIARRNSQRSISFDGLRPSTWEASISF